MKVVDCVLFFMVALCMEGCSDKQSIDPIWNIDPYSNSETILEQLNSGKGVSRYIYSFRKKMEWKRASVPVYVNSYLSYPDFEGEQLRHLRYTVSADFSETTFEFNTELYEFLKSTWISSFGIPNEESDQPANVVLKWNLRDMLLTITVNKQFNSYLVEYQR